MERDPRELPLSACVLAKNGADAILELTRLFSHCYEVVIADDGSEDQTVSVARAYGYKLVDVSNESTFAAKRTKGILACTSEWVLMLDTDERPTQSFTQEISALLKDCPPDIGGFELAFRTHFAGRLLQHGGASPIWVLRLFRRSNFVGFIGDIHERVALKGRTLRSQLVLDHFSYRETSHYLEKINLYTSCEADELARVAQVSILPPLGQLASAIRDAIVLVDERRGTPVKSRLRDAFKLTLKNRYVVLSLLPAYPAVRFLSVYLLRSGWRDGTAGLKYAVLSACYSTIKYTKFLEARRLEK